MNYTSFQTGSLTKRTTKSGFTWTLRYRQDGKHKAMVVGTNVELPTEKDALRKVASLTAVINESKSAYTFGQLVEKYIADEMPSRPQTAAGYLSKIRHLRVQFEDMPLEKMLKDLVAIKTWISELKSFPTKARIVNGKHIAGIPARPLSKKTKQHVKAMLHRLIECAMLWGYLPVDRNPISLIEVKVKGPQPVKRDKPPINEAQLWELVNYSGLSDHVKVMVKLCMFLGLRISEVLGLRWEDIDFAGTDGPVVRIVRGSVGKHIDETKSTASNAVMPMHPYIAETLQAWKASSVVVNGWLFGNLSTGRPFHRDSLQSDHLAPAGKALGIVNLGWHTFRHSHRAFLRQLNTQPETQQLLMRHANLSTTMDYGIDDSLMSVKRPAHEALVDTLLKGDKK